MHVPAMTDTILDVRCASSRMFAAPKADRYHNGVVLLSGQSSEYRINLQTTMMKGDVSNTANVE